MSKPIDTTRNPVTSARLDKGNLQAQLRYGFRAAMAAHFRAPRAWGGVAFLLALIVGVVFVVSGLAAAAQ